MCISLLTFNHFHYFYDKEPGSSCFHGSNSVSLKNGQTKLISELSPGDNVLTMKDDGTLVFSPVILDYHSAPQDNATFLVIRTSLGHNLTLQNFDLNEAFVVSTSFCIESQAWRFCPSNK